jgi:murein DD-endopeptidase MepM/ murein hydrolase activator NlpD
MRLLLSLLLAVSLTVLTTPARAAPVPAPDRDGVWPLSPRPQVVEGFDPPTQAWGAGHRGVDLLGHVGEPVHASLAGTVTFAARLAGRGVVVVDHGGTRTTYEPVSASVQVGARVARGGTIGTLQRSSSHCFPRACLHWGLLQGRTYLDPLTLVGAGPIRLLPLDGGAGAGLPLVPGDLTAGVPASPRPTGIPVRVGGHGAMLPV